MNLELKNFNYIRVDFFKNHNCIKQLIGRNTKKELEIFNKNFLLATQVKDYDYYEILVL